MNLRRILATGLVAVALSGVGAQSAQAATKYLDYAASIHSSYQTRNFTTSGGTIKANNVSAVVRNKPEIPKAFRVQLFQSNGFGQGNFKVCSSGFCSFTWTNIPKGTYFMKQFITVVREGQVYSVYGTIKYTVK